jgi:hypothetical protein
VVVVVRLLGLGVGELGVCEGESYEEEPLWQEAVERGKVGC